jgi:hypothetical protein
MSQLMGCSRFSAHPEVLWGGSWWLHLAAVDFVMHYGTSLGACDHSVFLHSHWALCTGIIAVGRHWGPVIPTSPRIVSLGPGEIPLLFWSDPQWSFRCMNHRQSTNHLVFDKPVKLHWWNMDMTRIRSLDPLILPNVLITWAQISTDHSVKPLKEGVVAYFQDATIDPKNWFNIS